MWTNAATLWCKIYSQESTSSCATGLCSIAILAVGETGRLAWCLKIIIGRRDARLPHRQDACATIDRISATSYDQQRVCRPCSRRLLHLEAAPQRAKNIKQ